MDTWDIAIVGGGPSGLMAGARAAQRGKRTLLLEKNRRPGVKILLSGGTRCNFTHAADARGIVEAFGPSGRFLHSALAAFGPQDVIAFFQSEGVPEKIEPDTGKIFPASDQASDVLSALINRLSKSGCELAPEESLLEIEQSANGFNLITSKRTISAEKILLATGGKSYPACGTTGDGYRWAAALGHTIVPLHAALAPVVTHALWVTALQGITIADVLVKVIEPFDEINEANGKTRCLASRRGSFLFTHFGVSGPAVLDVSRAISGYSPAQRLILQCDFLPGSEQEELDAHIAAQSASAGGRQVAVILDSRLPGAWPIRF